MKHERNGPQMDAFRPLMKTLAEGKRTKINFGRTVHSAHAT